jgi:hypothetical protein
VAATGNREVRNRALLREMLSDPNQTYAQMAHNIGLDVHYPAQTIYNRVKTDSFQAIMAEEIEKIYDKTELRKTVSKWLRSDSPTASLKAAELGMKEQAMLTERVETITKPHETLAEVSTDELQAELVQRLRIGQAGVFSDKQSPDGDKVALDADKLNADSKQETASKGKA